MTACDQAPTSPSSSPSEIEAQAPRAGGRAAILVDGLLASQSAEVVITGPGGFRRRLFASDTLTGLASGRYTVQATAVTGAGSTVLPELSAPYFDIAPSTPMPTIRALFGSRLRRSTVWVAMSGLPQGAPASVQLRNPQGDVTSFPQGGSLETALSGEWTLTAAPVQFAGHTYAPSPAVQRRTLRTPEVVTLSVSHALTTGALAVAITGLPPGSRRTCP